MCIGDMCVKKEVSAYGGSFAPRYAAPLALRLRLRGRGSGFAPIPPRLCGGSPPIPNTCAPLRGYLGGLPTAHLRAWACACATHLGTSQVAARRRTAVLRTRLPPPRWAGCPPHRSSTGLSPPARRVPPMHLAAHPNPCATAVLNDRRCGCRDVFESAMKKAAPDGTA